MRITLVGFFFLSFLINNLLAQKSIVWEVLEDTTHGLYDTQRGQIIDGNKLGKIIKLKSNGLDSLFLSENFGDDWHNILAANKQMKIKNVRLTESNEIFLVAYDYERDGNREKVVSSYILYSSDLGETWDKRKLPDSVRFGSFDMFNENYGAAFLVDVNDPGKYYLLYTVDGWETYKEIDRPEDIYYSRLWTPSEYVILIQNTSNEDYFFKTEDFGENWEKSDNSVPDGIRNAVFTDKNTIWAVGGKNNGIGWQRFDLIAKSTNTGISWEIIKNEEVIPKNGLEYIGFSPNKKYGLATGGRDKIYFTNDSGYTWQRQDLPSSFDWTQHIPQISFTANNYAFLLGNNYLLRYSGETTLKAPIFLQPQLDTTKIDNNIIIKWSKIDSAAFYEINLASDYYFNDILRIYDQITTETQQIKNLDYNKRYYLRVRAYNEKDTSQWSEKIWMITKDKPDELEVPKFVYPENFSENVEINPEFKWTKVDRAIRYHIQIAEEPIKNGVEIIFENENITDTTYQFTNLKKNQFYFAKIRALSENDSSKWNTEVGSGLRFTTGEHTGIDWQLINDINDFKIYPNPITNTGTIEFSIEKPANVKFSLFDITGRLINTIEDQYFSAGEHTINIDAANIPAGNYYLRMENGKKLRYKAVKILKE